MGRTARDVIDGRERWGVECSDALAWLRSLPAGIARTCVTSPPYFGLRDYGHDEQIGLEDTPEEYIAKLVGIFSDVRRVLTTDGTLWLNIGDSYAASGRGGGGGSFQNNAMGREISEKNGFRMPPPGWKQKDLLGIPWMVAFALRDDGWYLRQDIIWHKPNPMPESVTDRCTKAHEYLFLLSKSSRYYFDADAIAEKAVTPEDTKAGCAFGGGKCSSPDEAKSNLPGKKWIPKVNGGASFGKQNHDATGTGAQSRTYERPVYLTRNRRSVWTVTTKPYKGAHFATFPADLIEPCIMAGSATDDIVIEPFAGSGTTLAVAVGLGRRAIGSELNPDYLELTERRMGAITPALEGFA